MPLWSTISVSVLKVRIAALRIQQNLCFGKKLHERTTLPLTCSRGGIGRRAGLRNQCLRVCRFDSDREYYAPVADAGIRNRVKSCFSRVRVPLGALN